MIFDYDKEAPLNLEIKRLKSYELMYFDAPYKPEFKESKRIKVYMFRAEKPFYNLIFLHGIGNSNIPYLMWFAKWFAKKGVNSFFLILPYHEERAVKGWKGGEPFFHPSPSYCTQKFHEAVKDVRRTLDVIEGLENFSHLPTAVMGYSFGGMIATMALALDNRIKKGVLSFTGGNWRWINWKSPVTEVLREMYRIIGNEYGCRLERDCIKKRESSMDIVKSFNSIEDIFTKPPVKCFEYDPISYAKFIDVPVLVFRGAFDRIIPRKSTSDLIHFLKNKKVVTLPCGHKNSYFFRRLIAYFSLRFIKRND